ATPALPSGLRHRPAFIAQIYMGCKPSVATLSPSPNRGRTSGIPVVREGAAGAEEAGWATHGDGQPPKTAPFRLSTQLALEYRQQCAATARVILRLRRGNPAATTPSSCPFRRPACSTAGAAEFSDGQSLQDLHDSHTAKARSVHPTGPSGILFFRCRSGSRPGGKRLEQSKLWARDRYTHEQLQKNDHHGLLGWRGCKRREQLYR